MAKLYTIEEIIQYARENSPYYKNLYQGIREDASLEELPLLDQDDFWAHIDKKGGMVATGPHVDGQIFKSGGTTGLPKYALYSAEEWSTLCECTGDILVKGGLKNGTKVANVFYAGGMYASFLFTYSILYFSHAKVLQYNLSGNISIKEMVETIRDHQINCLAGLPSILTKIASYIRENNLTGFAVDTVYFAGETLYNDQRERLNETFGRQLDFRSITYASNDGGIIGYFTKDCGFNEHRIMSDLCYVELIDPDTKEVIHEMNHPGIITITSLYKRLVPLIRYPAGDMGEYTESEGAADRKFRILGRDNVAARAAYVSLYPEDVANVLSLCGIDYDLYQIVVEHHIRDQFIFRIAAPHAGDDDTKRFLETLFQERTFLKDALDDGVVEEPKVEWCSTEDLEYNPRTGKIKLVLDKRMSS